jgi:hypothetical protein
VACAHQRDDLSDADAVLIKPFDLDTLEGLVRRLLSAHNQHDA